MRTTDEPSEVELREPSTYDDSPAPLSTSMSDVPGPYERVAAALKVAVFAIGPAALLAILFSLDLFGRDPAGLPVGGALLWVTVLAGAGVVVRWLTLGASPFVERAATAPFIAAGLALTVELSLRIMTGNGEPYAGVTIAILCVGILVLYWSLASPLLARDGEPKRRRRQWKLRDLTMSLLLFGLYAAALRWMFGWFALYRGSSSTAVLYETAAFAGIFLIPFVIDLACRFAVRSRYRWAFAAMGCAISFGTAAWCAAQVGSMMAVDPTLFALMFGSAVYLPLSATLAVLTEWRPLRPTLQELDERLRSPPEEKRNDRRARSVARLLVRGGASEPMRIADNPPEIEPPEPATEVDLTVVSSPPTDVSGPYERVASALKIAALATGPAIMLGATFVVHPPVEFDWLFFVGVALIYGVGIAGAGVIAQWLALGASPFIDRAATAPFFVAALGAAVQFAVSMFAGRSDLWIGPMLTLPFVGVLTLYWSAASPFLARDGDTNQTPTQWKIRDLSIGLLLAGLYAAALRWLVVEAPLNEEDVAKSMALWIGYVAGVGLILFAIDLVCRCVARSRRRWIFVAVGIVPGLAAAVGSLVGLRNSASEEPIALIIFFGSACYLFLSATIAGLTVWRPLLPAVRRLDRRIELRRDSRRAERAQEAPLGSSSVEERS